MDAGRSAARHGQATQGIAHRTCRRTRRAVCLPRLRKAPRKAIDGKLTTKQAAALAEFEATDLFRATAWWINEKLGWIRNAGPVRKALETFEYCLRRILQRWTSPQTNARLEGLGGLFHAARSRVRGYRNTADFISMIYLIAAPRENLFDSI